MVDRAYLGIPKDVRSVATADFEPQDGQSTLLKGGFYYGKNLRGKVYVPPRPLLNHGLHRCELPLAPGLRYGERVV